MTTAFLAVQSAIAAAVAPALSGGVVGLNRLRPIPAGQATAIVVRLDQTTGAEQALGALDWTTSYAVECYAKAATGTDPAAAVDALFADVWTRLAAINSGAIGAMAITLNPQIDWQYDDAETPFVCVLIRLAVQHRTAFTSLTALP